MPSLANERIKADLILLAVSVIWGSAFVVQRVVALEIGVFLFNGLRFLIGVLVLLPFTFSLPARAPRLDDKGILLAGSLLFGGAALQQFGLRYTTAGNAGFVTGLYVVIIPVILALGWRQKPRKSIWVASLMAASGLFLLSTRGELRLNIGDTLELGGAILWAFHVILIGRLVHRLELVHLAIGQYLVCGLLNLGAAVFLETNSISTILDASWALLYTGILSVGLGYTWQAKGQKLAPPADAAIILCLEAVFAAFFGWMFLNELLSGWQLLGSGLMLAGMFLSQADVFANQARVKSVVKPVRGGDIN